MRKPISKDGWLYGSGEIFLRKKRPELRVSGYPSSLFPLASLFWVKVPKEYLVFSLQSDAKVSSVLPHLQKLSLPLVLLDSETQDKGRVRLFNEGDVADAARAAVLVKVCCGWAEEDVFEISSDARIYQITADLEKSGWVTRVVAILPQVGL